MNARTTNKTHRAADQMRKCVLFSVNRNVTDYVHATVPPYFAQFPGNSQPVAGLSERRLRPLFILFFFNREKNNNETQNYLINTNKMNRGQTNDRQ